MLGEAEAYGAEPNVAFDRQEDGANNPLSQPHGGRMQVHRIALVTFVVYHRSGARDSRNNGYKNTRPVLASVFCSAVDLL
jgi:hypothetical protein